MYLVGLTGGIGSGKSTVAAGLAARGAAIVDADAISREIMEPGGEGLAAVVGHFGDSVLGPDGRLDRPALAALVFADADRLKELNDLTHPIIGRVMAEKMEAAGKASDIVVLDIPLLNIATKDRFTFNAIVVVDLAEDLAVSRLVSQRGFTEADARARIAAQISREERKALADAVIDNSGDRAALESEIDRVWALLGERATERSAGGLKHPES